MPVYRTIPSSKHIALVAHDNRKDELLEWALANRESLSIHHLYATGTTGKMLETNLRLPFRKLLSGPLGGDQQLGAMIAEQKIDVMIFFWDPLSAQPHDPDIKALLRLCVVWNIPLACDSATADFLFTSPFMSGEYNSRQSDFTEYLTRKIGTE